MWPDETSNCLYSSERDGSQAYDHLLSLDMSWYTMYRISLDIGRNRLDDTQVRLFLEVIPFVLFPQRNMMGDEGRPVT